jgi:Zn-dependent protease with chaperone function
MVPDQDERTPTGGHHVRSKSTSEQEKRPRGAGRLLVGLFGFAALYLALTVGCLAAPIVLVIAASSQPLLWILAAPAVPLFGALLFVLLRKLVHRAQIGGPAIELSPIEQPRLFTLLERLCARARAPMPDRVSLSPGVNAAMLRSTSAIGLLFGGPRELVLGLGLINVIEVGELEAVIAHELGHFSQASARLGQWAHRTTVLLRELVLGRDRFDDRIARARRARSPLIRGFANLLFTGIRGIRRLFAGVLDRITCSSLALARELEFDADRHAVALCGSDAIVAALWRAQRGAIAMDHALAGLRELAKHGLFSDDLYVHQSARWAELDRPHEHDEQAEHPMLTALRRPYQDGPSLHFPPGETPAEVMWYSHPSYAEREANAKRTYVVALDRSRVSAWELFDDRDALCRRATAAAYAQLGLRAQPTRRAAEIEQRLADERAERTHGQSYFGFYDNRILDLGDIEALIREAESTDLASLAAAAEPWRGPALEQFMLVGTGDQPRIFGDQQLFRWWWRQADADQRLELEQRGKFLVFVQAQIVTLNRHRNIVAPMFATATDPDDLHQALDALHGDLVQLLEAAESIVLPELQNLEGRESTRAYLLGEPLVNAYADDGETALREWLSRFMPQVGSVHERLRTLHYKNLGRLLALRERIEARAEP